MNPDLQIGRIAGIRVGLNWSWLIVFGLIVWSLAQTIFPSQDPGLSSGTYAAMAVAAALLYFTSILLHEVGHALQARREGMEIDGITLWLFGGVARFRGTFPSAGAEFRIAIAGPLVSLLLGLAFVGLALGTNLSTPVDGVAAWLGYINLALLVFNLVPALPLDGGRMFRAALWKITGDFVAATRIATGVATMIGGAMILGGIVLLFYSTAWSGLWLAFLGWFLLGAARVERQLAAVQALLGGGLVRDAMTRRPRTLPPDATIGELLAAAAAADGGQTVYPVMEGGRVIGVVPVGWAASVPRAEWGRRVSEGALPLSRVPVLRPDEELLEALQDLAGQPLHEGVVLDGDQLVGLLSLADLERALARRRAVVTP